MQLYWSCSWSNHVCLLDHCTSNDASTTWAQSAVERHGNARLHRWCEIGLSRFMIYSLLWWILDKISMLGRTTNFHALPVWRHGYIDFLEVLISSVCPTPRECSEECSALSHCFFVLEIAPFIHQVYQSRRLPYSTNYLGLQCTSRAFLSYAQCLCAEHKIGSAAWSRAKGSEKWQRMTHPEIPATL